MHTILILTNSRQTETDLQRLFSADATVLTQGLAVDEFPENVQRLRPLFKRADALLIDFPSLGNIGKQLTEALPNVVGETSVIARLNRDQAAALALPDAWTLSLDTDAPQRLHHAMQLLLDQRDLRFRADQLHRSLAQQQQLLTAARDWAQTERARGYVSVGQYREALKTLSRLFSHTRSVPALSEQFLALLRELLGLSKLALFLRPMELALVHKTSAARKAANRYTGVASIGLPHQTVAATSLSTESGIGQYVTSEGKILRRSQIQELASVSLDPHTAKEFELLAADAAVPIQDSETTLGVLTFSGKITGEELTSEDLEFIFALCNTVASAIKNLWLAGQISSQQQFTQDVLANIQSGVVVVNHHTQVALINARARDLLGLKEDASAGRDIAWLPPSVGDLLFETLRTGRQHARREIKVPQSDRQLSLSVSRFAADATESNENYFVVGVLDDMTQSKAEDAVERKTEHDDFLLQLAARLTHELRNSLVSVRTFAELLPEKYKDAAFRDEFHRMMHAEVIRMDKVVGSINFFARPLELDLQALPVADVIENAITRVCAEIGGTSDAAGARPSSIVLPSFKTVNLLRHFTHNVVSISGDRMKLEESLMHLLRNAIQSMQTTGGRITIGTEDIAEKESSPTGVLISITDTGEGISLSEFETVFQPFYTTRNVGIGLGLAIAKKTVEAHGGRIEINSKLGKGTTMKALLPISRDINFNAPAPRGTKPEPAPVIRYQPPVRSEG